MKIFRVLVAAILVTAVLPACGGGARSTTTDKVGSTSVSTAPPMNEGSPEAAPTSDMQPRSGSYTQPIPSGLDCPADEIVWVNTKKHVYHYASDQYYGRTKNGKYMCERDAQREHDRAVGSKKAGGASTMRGSGKHHRRGGAMSSPSPEET